MSSRMRWVDPQFGQTSELGGEAAGVGEVVGAVAAEAGRREDFEGATRVRAEDEEVGVMVCTWANRRLVYIT